MEAEVIQDEEERVKEVRSDITWLPLQYNPSPSYRLLQRQTYEPSVFVHSAFTSQLLESDDAHSSMSAIEMIVNSVQ